MKLVLRTLGLAALLALTADPALAQWTVKLEPPTPLAVTAQEKKVVIEQSDPKPAVVLEKKTVIVEPGTAIVIVKGTLVTPEPVPLGVPYLYQVGNPYGYIPYFYYPTPYGTYSSPYPFGSVTPVFGLYSWDYGVYYPGTYKLYSSAAVTSPVVPAAAYYPIATSPTVTYPVVSGYSAYYPYYYPYVGVYPAVPGRYWLGFGW